MDSIHVNVCSYAFGVQNVCVCTYAHTEFMEKSNFRKTGIHMLAMAPGSGLSFINVNHYILQLCTYNMIHVNYSVIRCLQSPLCNCTYILAPALQILNQTVYKNTVTNTYINHQQSTFHTTYICFRHTYVHILVLCIAELDVCIYLVTATPKIICCKGS